MDLPQHYQALVDRFVALYRDDPHVLAAYRYSDLDLGVVTTDEGYPAEAAARAAFLRRLGEPLLLEDFDLPGIVFFIFPDGTEGELAFAPASDLGRLHAGPYRVVLDK